MLEKWSRAKREPPLRRSRVEYLRMLSKTPIWICDKCMVYLTNLGVYSFIFPIIYFFDSFNGLAHRREQSGRLVELLLGA